MPTNRNGVKAAGEERGEKGPGEIAWKEWSEETFEKAAREDKLILLDLTATWCHWCHVMDGTTYSDPEVVSTVNREFVPVRVDIDRRPDISERYNRGGFPTTAFLSAQGESVWGATYIPPADMRRIMESVLNAKRSGEIDQALERARMLDTRRRTAGTDGCAPSEADLERAFNAILGAYDEVHGGFGTEPKFPHPDVLDLLMFRHNARAEPAASAAVEFTLERMAEGLYDKVEGGVFRYSVTRDWSVPHYEKMLETNLGFMRNLARARVTFGIESFGGLADGVASYLAKQLRDPGSGGFYGSQDADEEYYKLDAKGRSRRVPPSVDRTAYSGWNALASAVFMEAGALLDRSDWVRTGLSTLDHVLGRLWDPQMNLVRHAEGLDLYLFEDQAELMSALVECVGHRDIGWVDGTATRLIEGARRSFAHPDGGFGDIIPGEGVGDLAVPIRSLVTNSKWAHRLALLGMALDRTELVDDAAEVVGSFDGRTVAAHGMFAASYLVAAETLRLGPVKVEVRSPRDSCLDAPLWTASKKAMQPRAVTVFVKDADESAVVCSRSGCSAKLETPGELVRWLRERLPN